MGDILDVESGQLGVDALIQSVLGEKFPIGEGRGGKAPGHLHPGCGQVLDHLPERGILPADFFNIINAQLMEPQHVSAHNNLL